MNQAIIIDCLRTPAGKAPKGIPRDEIEDVILGCANPEDRSARTHVAAEKVSRRSETCATWACKSLIGVGALGQLFQQPQECVRHATSTRHSEPRA
jgi:hypothetical protein